MGRGRQKAKQTKVARRLKYYSPETDYRALEKELAAARSGNHEHDYEIPPAEDDNDYSDWR
ncbi:MAG TPA: DUF3073 domain-containing protein [Actinomycetaceae bacterium]|nr:DUF3073 domain-containing protein [Actinomycetaceae bacterium]